jgi:hypothetical protein
MIQTFEAIIDEHGEVRILGSVALSEPRRALVMVLDESPKENICETALLSEASLAKDWNRPE